MASSARSRAIRSDLFSLPRLGLGLGGFFRGHARRLRGGFARRALFRLAGQLFLPQLLLLGRALLTRLEDSLAFGLLGQHRRIVRSRLCLELFQKRLLGVDRRGAAVSETLVSVDQQIHSLAVMSRRLHTRRAAKFKRR